MKDSTQGSTDLKKTKNQTLCKRVMMKNECWLPPGQALWGKPRISFTSVWYLRMGGDTESPQVRPGPGHPQALRLGELTGQKRGKGRRKSMGEGRKAM